MMFVLRTGALFGDLIVLPALLVTPPGKLFGVRAIRRVFCGRHFTLV